MKPFLYQGRYSPDLLRHVLDNAQAFEKTMRASIEAFGGRLIRCRLSAESSNDPIGFVDFPSDIAARSWNAYYARQEGVVASKIQRLLDDDDLKEMSRLIEANQQAASGHRSSSTP